MSLNERVRLYRSQNVFLLFLSMVGSSNIFLAQFPKYRHFFTWLPVTVKFFQKYFDIRQPISIILGRAAACKHHTDAAYCYACRTFRGLCVCLCVLGQHR